MSGNPEIIQDGFNGLLVPVESPDSLARAINRLLADESLRKQFTQNARATLNRFDVPGMMECTFRLYREVVEN